MPFKHIVLASLVSLTLAACGGHQQSALHSDAGMSHDSMGHQDKKPNDTTTNHTNSHHTDNNASAKPNPLGQTQPPQAGLDANTNHPSPSLSNNEAKQVANQLIQKLGLPITGGNFVDFGQNFAAQNAGALKTFLAQANTAPKFTRAPETDIHFQGTATGYGLAATADTVEIDYYAAEQAIYGDILHQDQSLVSFYGQYENDASYNGTAQLLGENTPTGTLRAAIFGTNADQIIGAVKSHEKGQWGAVFSGNK